MMTPALSFWLLLSSIFWSGAQAYIPASGSDVPMVFNNVTEASKLQLRWLAGGYGPLNVSYELVGANSNGVNKGVLVHFSEDDLTNDMNDNTTTPWIALISCDNNATNADLDNDIFTLAQQKGAVAALLYSLNNETCIIDPDFAGPDNYDGAMDVFTSPSLNVSKTIEFEFTQINGTKFVNFTVPALDSVFELVNSTIYGGSVTDPDFLFASLTAWNATLGSSSNGTVASTNDGSSMPPQHNSQLAMIILYVITGCVSALFCVVIISGAVRAIRHPERYGPRAGTTPGTPGYVSAQSRARGLGRAILDTFPIVKFGNTEEGLQQEDAAAPGVAAKNLESGRVGTGAGTYADDSAKSKSDVGSMDMELRTMPALAMISTAESDGVSEEARHVTVSPPEPEGEGDGAPPPFASTSTSAAPGLLVPGPRPRRARTGGAHAHAVSAASGLDSDLVPDAIGRETCPICIVDFEEGDDLRVLPCEGHHRFHQQCVDPWLLELSSSCPICRQDFHALETMMSQESDVLEPPPPIGMMGSGMRPLSVASAGARLSRYLRLARRRRRDRERGDGYDPTNPPMPEAPETTL